MNGKKTVHPEGAVATAANGNRLFLPVVANHDQ